MDKRCNKFSQSSQHLSHNIDMQYITNFGTILEK